MSASTALVYAIAAAPVGGIEGFLAAEGPFILIIPLFILYYFMILRPQQRRARDHAAGIAAVKRGDMIVMSNGMIGKVVRVEDAEVGVEIAQNVTVKVVKSMIAEVRTRGEPAAANDARS